MSAAFDGKRLDGRSAKRVNAVKRNINLIGNLVKSHLLHRLKWKRRGRVNIDMKLEKDGSS